MADFYISIFMLFVGIMLGALFVAKAENKMYIRLLDEKQMRIDAEKEAERLLLWINFHGVFDESMQDSEEVD